MRILNITKGTIISNNAERYTSILSKAIGLMFSKQKDLIFQEKKEKIIPLHMLFVFFQIDVIYLSKKKQVVEIKKNLLPFTAYFPKKKAQYVLELKKGTIEKSNTNINDFLEFQ